MWEFATGNTFGGTALSSYGGFWLSYAVILTPGVSTASGPVTPICRKAKTRALGNMEAVFLNRY